MPFATIRSLDSTIESQRQRAVSRVEAMRIVPVRRQAHDSVTHKSDIWAQFSLPFVIDGTVTTTGELNRELRCGRCGVVLGPKEVLCWSCSGTTRTSDPTLFDRTRVSNAIAVPIEDCDVVNRRESRHKRALQERAALASRIASCKFGRPYRDRASLVISAKKASNKANGRRTPAANVQLYQWRARSEAMLRIMYDPTCIVDDDFYEFWRYENVRPRYARFLREGLRRGDGSLARSGVAQAVGWLHRQFPSMQLHMRILRGLNARACDIQPEVIETASGRGTRRNLCNLEFALKMKDKNAAGPSKAAGAEAPRGEHSQAMRLPDLVSIERKRTRSNSAGDTAEVGPTGESVQVHMRNDSRENNLDPLDDLIASLGAMS